MPIATQPSSTIAETEVAGAIQTTEEPRNDDIAGDTSKPAVEALPSVKKEEEAEVGSATTTTDDPKGSESASLQQVHTSM